LFIEIKKDGITTFAYPDVVCMAILEYYAFEARGEYPEAIANFRRLASYGLQKFIYEALQYTPADKWRHYHDRVSLIKGAAPDGYWRVFNEISGLIVDLINSNLTVNDKTIPDISVGIAWGIFSGRKKLAEKCGNRIKCPHDYPSYFRQAASNPQYPWAYPDAALPEFNRWFRHEYLITKFPPYILSKAKMLPGGKAEATAIGAMYAPPNEVLSCTQNAPVSRPGRSAWFPTLRRLATRSPGRALRRVCVTRAVERCHRPPYQSKQSCSPHFADVCGLGLLFALAGSGAVRKALAGNAFKHRSARCASSTPSRARLLSQCGRYPWGAGEGYQERAKAPLREISAHFCADVIRHSPIFLPFGSNIQTAVSPASTIKPSRAVIRIEVLHVLTAPLRRTYSVSPAEIPSLRVFPRTRSRSATCLG
jgi:hypothetical protein